MLPSMRLPALLATLVALSVPNVATAEPVPFADTYQSYNTSLVARLKAAPCSRTAAISGRDPGTPGGHPVAIYTHGTFGSENRLESQAIIDALARHGFVAGAVGYDDLFATSLAGIDNNSKCIHSGAGSAVSRLCSRPAADCSFGVAVVGHSQGAAIAARAANFNPNVRAAYLMGLNDTALDRRTANSSTNGTRALSDNRVRIVDGVSDAPPYRRGDLNQHTGGSCPIASTACLDPLGAGWLLVLNTDVEDGTGDHCYFAVSRCLGRLDKGWLGEAPWSLNFNVEWLRARLAS